MVLLLVLAVHAKSLSKMWITRNKEGELIGMSPRKEEAMIIAEKSHKRDEYIIQEALDQVELFEIYRSYYKTRSV